MTITKQIYEKNRDLLLRVKNEKVTASYFKREDVFRIFFGKPKNSLGITIANGLLTIHYDPKDYRIYGFTIPYMKEFILFCDYFDGRKDKLEYKMTQENPKKLIDPIANAGLTGLSFAC